MIIKEKKIQYFFREWNLDKNNYPDFMEFLEQNNIRVIKLKKYYRVYGAYRYGNLKIYVNDEIIFDGDEYYSDESIFNIVYSYFLEQK